MQQTEQRVLAIIGIIVAAALLVGQIIVGVSINNLVTDLANVAKYAKVIQADARTGNLTTLSVDLKHLDSLTKKASDAAGLPANVALGNTTSFAGQYVNALRALGTVSGQVSGAAKPLADLLPSLKPSALVTSGSYNVGRLRTLSTDANVLGKTLELAPTELAAISRKGMDSRFVKVLDGVQRALKSASTSVDEITPVLVALPDLVGSNGPRTWLVVLQNLAEARGTGGLPGSYAVIHVDGGKVSLVERGSDKKLIAHNTIPTTGLPSSFLNDWGPYLTSWSDFNVSPNFPYTGLLASNEWSRFSGQKVDGVLAIGQGVVQTMMSATGPIVVDGNTLDSSNIVEFLTNGVYGKYPNPDVKDKVVGDVVAAVFAKLSSGSFDLNSLAKGSKGNKTSDRLLAWSSIAADQATFVSAGLAGVLPKAEGPTVALTINNRGGNKLEQYLHVKADYSLGVCPSLVSRTGTMKITLTNAAPTSGLPTYVTPREDPQPDGVKPPVGSNLELVTVYAPVKAFQKTFTLDGKTAFVTPGIERNHPFFSFYVEMNPGQTRVLNLTWTEGVKRGTNQGTVITQPMLNPVVVTTPKAAPCKSN
jgi:hypothetical protein